MQNAIAEMNKISKACFNLFDKRFHKLRRNSMNMRQVDAMKIAR